MASKGSSFAAPLIKISAVSAALAQMSMTIGNARSAVDRAIWVTAQDDAPPMQRFCAVVGARITTAKMATFVARTSHQLHGAMGVTRECGLHCHTRIFWAWRDADATEQERSRQMGSTAPSVGEATLWEHISA
jgi:acyl-CoA dehydrogenase